jgi:outer membrane protein TolC
MEKILDEQSVHAKRLVEISQAYANNGLLLNQDVLNAKIQAQEVDIAKKNLQREKEIQLIEIQKMFSGEIDLSEIDFSPDEKKLNSFLALSRSTLEESAVDENNDQMKMLNALIETSRLAKKIADATIYWKPDIALQSSLGYTGMRFPFIQEDWNDYGKYSLNFSLGIRATVWDGGKAFRNMKRKEDDLNVTLSQYNDSVMQLKMAAATAYSDMALAESKWKYQKLLIENDELKLKQHESEYKAGYGTEIDVLKAKIQKLTDTITSYQLQTEMYMNCLTLDYLTGGRL